MSNYKRIICNIVLIGSLLLQTACAQNYETKDNSNEARNIQPFNANVTDERITLASHQGQKYVPIQPLADLLGYQVKFDEQNKTITIGDIDPYYQLTLDSLSAQKEEEDIQLTEAPTMIENQPCIPISLLSDLFQQDLNYEVEDNSIVLHPTSNETISIEDVETTEEPNQQEPFFQDDPEDPFKGEDPEVWKESDAESVWNDDLLNDESITALKNINMNALIKRARQYMGVRYDFGAGPYPRTKRFDCSSYTQYIYGKYGIRLKRVSRNQARQGTFVSRKKLRKGDLVFFSVPGRFKSNKTVGHVGIYIGNGRMINTYSNKKGVHIAAINKGYWSKKYITARRVAY